MLIEHTCLCIAAHTYIVVQIAQIASIEDVPSLVVPLQGQDKDPIFRKLLGMYQDGRRVAAVS